MAVSADTCLKVTAKKLTKITRYKLALSLVSSRKEFTPFLFEKHLFIYYLIIHLRIFIQL